MGSGSSEGSPTVRAGRNHPSNLVLPGKSRLPGKMCFTFCYFPPGKEFIAPTNFPQISFSHNKPDM